MPYLCEDEDNGPMNDSAFDRIDEKISTPAIYMETSVEEPLPFDDPTPDEGCWNCIYYTGDACSHDWKDGDESEYIPDDDRGWGEWCNCWKENPDARWEELNESDT